ncbi:hypothetical protein BCF58_0278 [Chryseobacterium defluvii]|uniref:Uncharacterized protein n=2 Tax=Chryseobacterium defluvii TaxID=160396 RepID=A0A495SLZ3_9FLAO|nr:hypothetical protein BCF58_0278 [Chryseobacterium defluvii]
MMMDINFKTKRMENTIKILLSVVKIKNKALYFFSRKPSPENFEIRKKYELDIAEIERAILILKGL